MNILLLNSGQINGTSATITGRQLEHLQTVQNLGCGDSVRVGEINGSMGTAIISEIDQRRAVLDLTLDTPPPPPLPLTLIMAMPRPKMLRRILQTVAAMGVKTIYLINSVRVEKSFWQTPFLSAEALQAEFLLGLEQAKDTRLPEIQLRKLFKPFVEDELSDLIGESKAIVAHPTGPAPCPINIGQPTTLLVGPEGGFIPYEIGKLEEVGVEPVSIGPRILRVETAVPALISRLFPA
ncbi:MAG: 16S rRNA (uracil(1498)-N(3))-methyltransferase [Porticoccaceae bacterium]|nr:16S rRNA (uracil(1498)-N(3))-methyltransferase [Porticoccaceae bacterium]